MSSALKKSLRRMVVKTGGKIVHSIDHLYGRYSLVGDAPFFDPDDFPWVKDVESHWSEIRRELDALLAYRDQLPNFQDLSPEQYELTQDDGWKTVFFYAYGVEAEGNCRRCPATAAALQKIPDMKTAFFSILSPHKHLPAHRGPYKGVLRYHLALKVPEPAQKCGIRVRDEVRHWEEGKSLVFDDAFDHEAWNDTDEVRAVLFVDFVRPLKFPASLLNRMLIGAIAASPYVSGSAKNQRAWEERFERFVNEQH
ncbi:MAG: aspartyl/asparaginyl beta-hydroxylase domain-containing protein [Hyphomicrobiales bacterium]|nr:aspartyl/asparaginyl beta-hydroxylase domain-containing protein [Hyphomicrobiales bacterium]